MDTDFWLQRWQQGQTGFHQSRVMPLLEKHWAGLRVPVPGRVLIPLAGKSLDVAWLAAQGHDVLAVEISPMAVDQFFQEHGLHPEVRQTPEGTIHEVGHIQYLCGDVLKLSAATLATIDGCYDRAALIALTPELRRRYVERVYHRLPEGCRTLLLTLDYPQQEMQGPPFAVPDDEVVEHFEGRWRIERLETRDILDKEPKFAARGLTRLETSVYRLTAR
ncbi:MAG: thiopurine S-methyltransferase [Castellaniella sp.]|uniref:thiopurine S-methyltransferase n=1 Tax=Castellaniella sp. TaxID=1955812 RepID=UPI001208B371|nr:thiopurine S-methyltransferase [Castellaniella sp.]TAN27343.1 MAG: thiopurine S-methyltransferase [Castellaniella sp.]